MTQRIAGLGDVTRLLTARHNASDVLEAAASVCAERLSAQAAAILLQAPHGGLRLAVTTEERPAITALLRTLGEQGPGRDAVQEVAIQVVEDVAARAQDWSERAEAAQAAGVSGLAVFPLRLDHHAAGALAVLSAGPTRLAPDERDLGQTLADLAVLGLIQERDEQRAERLAERCLGAFNDRAELLQAIGVVAGATGTDAERAADLLSTHARRLGRPVRGVAHDIVEQPLDPLALLPSPGP